MSNNVDNIFDDYFNNINLNNELKKFYEIINNESLNDSFEAETILIDLRNQNYKKYNEINILQLENISSEFSNIITEIKEVYNCISADEILKQNIEEAEQTKKLLDIVFNLLNRLDIELEKELKIIEKDNTDKQKELEKIIDQHDKKMSNKILSKYNDIIIYNATIESNVLENYKRQINIKKNINDIYKLLNLKVEQRDVSFNEVELLNKKIINKVKEIKETIVYLEDILSEKSVYAGEFSIFKNYINEVIAYDDTDYSSVSRVYKIICEELKIQSLLNYFEESFIKEREEIIKEENFIFEKYGIKNIKTALDYISANYIEFISDSDKNSIKLLYDKINAENCDLSEIYIKFKLIVDDIWLRTITDVYSYVPNEEFCFICTNNEFVDEKHEAILITNRMLDRVQDYSDYQIGFICNFNKNILYITENNNIMTIDYNDMSNLKTPKQLEQEFLNFRVSNRIALNGYITKFSAVYFINDGNMVKYIKAVELANQYNLPLIVLKKDKN